MPREYIFRYARDHLMQSKIARNIKICVTCTNCTKNGVKMIRKKPKVGKNSAYVATTSSSKMPPFRLAKVKKLNYLIIESDLK